MTRSTYRRRGDCTPTCACAIGSSHRRLPSPRPVCAASTRTPAGTLQHIVYRTDETVPPGWVVQPDHVPLFEDYNIPRAVRHAVIGPEDLPKLRYLLQEPTKEQLAAYGERMARVRRFAAEEGVLVQGWSAFGMDGVIWLTGVERAILAAMTEPDFFQELVDTVYAFDRRPHRDHARRGWGRSGDSARLV